MSEFLSQGGYAYFVWMSYGVTAAVLIAEVVSLGKNHRTILKRLGRMQRIQSDNTRDGEHS